MKTKYQTKQNQKKDKDFYLMVEMKLERLVAALYLVSNFFSDTEPMKWKFRDIGLNMLTDISKLKDSNIKDRTSILSHTLSNSITVLSLLEIARLSDFVTDMNYGILRREFMSFSNLLRSRDEIHESMSELELSDDFFNMAQSTTPVIRQTNEPNLKVRHFHTPKMSHTQEVSPMSKMFTDTSSEKSQLPKPTQHLPEKKVADLTLPPQRVPESQQVIRQTQPPTQNTPTQTEEREVSPRVVERKSYRRNVILDVLRTKQELSIKDISTIVTDCSEKTIQRELLGMVEEGMLTKTGERRWSRYSLAS